MSGLAILEAKAKDNLCVELFFNDNSSRIVDVGDFIRKHPHPQYNKYLDETEFRKFHLDDGNIVWGEDWDLIVPLDQLHAGFE